MKSRASKLTSYIYLLLVPIITTVLGFGVGHVSYKFYLPIWLLNVVLMIIASWSLGLNVIRLKNEEENKLAKAAFFLIVPWILISMFAGLGPPPTQIAAEWKASATEQQVRYVMLVICGVFVAFGFASLRDRLKSKGEEYYSRLAYIAILIATPLFIINMLFWGFYLSELFEIQVKNNATDFPEWFLPIQKLFGSISVVEVSLTYFATFVIVLSLKRIGWLSRTSGFFYLLFSLLAIVLIILFVLFTKVFMIGALVLVPGFPFLMPYFIGINLLRRAGNTKRTNSSN
jgi:hypothetical protein